MKLRVGVGVVVSCLLGLFTNSLLQAQLANAPWPMFHADARHTGQSPFRGSRSGILVWSYVTGDTMRSSPVVDSSEQIYIGSFDNRVYTFTSAGSLSWSYRTGDRVWSVPAIGITALAPDGWIFMGSSDNRVYGIRSSGSLAWSYRTGDSVISSPVIGPDGQLCVGSYDSIIYAFPWSYRTSSGVLSSPAVDSQGAVYVPSYMESQGSRVYAISSPGSLIWSYILGDKLESSPAIGTDGGTYVGCHDRRMYALSPTGALAWSYRTGDWVTSSPAVGSGGFIYVGSEDNSIYAFTSAGVLSWSYNTGLRVGSSPALGFDAMVYVGSEDRNLYSLISTGILAWSYKTGGSVYSSPSIGSSGRVYVGSFDNALYVFEGPPTPTPVIDLSANKTTFSTTDHIIVSADVWPISTPCYPFVRIVMTDGQTLYYERGKGFRSSPTPYLGFKTGVIFVATPIMDYPVLNIAFMGIATGMYYLEGGAVDAVHTTSASNLVYIGTVDRDVLTVQ